MLTSLFLTLWRMSVYGAVTALVVLAAVLALRRLRAPRAVCCALWLAVLVRLLCPVSFSSALSIFNAPALGRCVEAVQGQAALPRQARQNSAPRPAAPADAGAPEGGLSGQARPSGQLSKPARQADAAPASGAAGAGSPGTALPLLAGGWLAGAAAMALYGLWGAARLRRRVALAFCVPGEPGVFTGEGIAEPFAFGAVRPRIYLPLGLGAGERRIILLHEQAHLRRRDNLVKPLFYAALCLHWFNPLAWLAFREMAADMEAACDEAVLRAAGGGVKAAYCQSLLRFSGPRARAAVALSFGEGRVSGRVRAVLRYKRPAVWAALSAALAAALLAAACMADPAAGGPADSEPATSTPAASEPAASEPAASEPADSAAAASLPAQEGEALPMIYSSDGSLLWPAPEYTRWQEVPDLLVSRLAMPEDSVLLAMADGEVFFAQPPVRTESGALYEGTLVLVCPDGSHISYTGPVEPLVKEGDEVEQGQVIAALGSWEGSADPFCLLQFEDDQGERVSLWTLFEELDAPEPALRAEVLNAQPDISSDPGRLTWPVPEYRFVSRWMDSCHKGADIVAKSGTPILATAGGEVITAYFHFSYGNYVVIDHGNGWRSLYAHCSELLVKAGDTVERGQEIARVGSTGNTTGNQCHFELYCGGVRVSAQDYFHESSDGPVPDYIPES